MSDAFWIALFAAIPATLTAIFGILNLRKTGKLGEKVVEPLATIHTLVNAQLTAVTRRAEIAEAKVDELERAKALANGVKDK